MVSCHLCAEIAQLCLHQMYTYTHTYMHTHIYDSCHLRAEIARICLHQMSTHTQTYIHACILTYMIHAIYVQKSLDYVYTKCIPCTSIRLVEALCMYGYVCMCMLYVCMYACMNVCMYVACLRTCKNTFLTGS